MTTAEIHYYIDQGLQRMGYFVHDHFEQQEIDVHINKVIRDSIKALHAQKQFDKLYPLIKLYAREDNLVPFTYSDENIGRLEMPYIKVPFPSNYFLFTSASIRAHVSECTASLKSPVKTIPVVVRYEHEEDNVLSNPYSRTSNKKVLSFFTDTGIKVYTDKRVIIKGIFINYICKPTALDVVSYPERTPDLAEAVHDQIADLTIEVLKRIIEKTE
jgi:hypothetical protein